MEHFADFVERTRDHWLIQQVVQHAGSLRALPGKDERDAHCLL
jgi:hypothetical protein